ncbi:MAG: hypothetical protein ACJAUW_000771 [Yoonia sp.]|jgi:hypothetical protein
MAFTSCVAPEQLSGLSCHPIELQIKVFWRPDALCPYVAKDLVTISPLSEYDSDEARGCVPVSGPLNTAS